MIKKIAIILVLFFSIFAGIVAFQPDDFVISRSVTTKAAPFAIYAQINVLKNWEAWSPWAKLDPNMTKTYEGPEFGVGAIYHWSGNSEVGEGRMTIIEAKSNELVKIKLEFIKPFQAINDTEFKLQTEGEQTTVTWSMSGKRNFFEKAFNLVFNMESIVGADFVKGLEALKSVSESEVAH